VTAALGHPRVHHRRTDSTNARARELAAAGAPHGTVVTASEQTAGRGRQGRTWSAPPDRALLCSLVIRDPEPLLPLAAALAVADVAGDRARIKWPNDVLLDGGKLAGILIEGRPQEGWAVLGIGINVAVRREDLPPELHDTAATLGREPHDVDAVLDELLAALERWLPAGDDEVLARYRDLDAVAGREIRWATGTGVAAGIADDGGLLVRVADGETVTLAAGEVHLGPAHSSIE
jgi:BirA family transcriptional regulator, biotin operon repressor / biotin---[acetyl-CoA-carboxylase] ligase